MEHQEPDGLLKPPSSQEQTELPLAGLRTPDAPQGEQLPMRRLTLTEADLRRATKDFIEPINSLPEPVMEELRSIAFELSEFIIKTCPEGKDRSTSLAYIKMAVLCARSSLE